MFSFFDSVFFCKSITFRRNRLIYQYLRQVTDSCHLSLIFMLLLYIFKRLEIRILQIAGVIHKSKTTCFTFEKTISFYVKDGTLESKTTCFTTTTPPSRVYTRICYNCNTHFLSRTSYT